jgi:hypothetical protein
LEWIGYLVRIDHARVLEKIFDSKSEGRKTIERPRPRWLEDVEMNLRVIKVKR